jgi:GNAT superfamily N-acetyltransferase
LTPEIVSLEDKHLEDAAALVNARYAALREDVPSLPSRYEDSGAILPYLRDLAGKAPGVAAICSGQLSGFLLGFVIPSFRGKRSIFSPEWANGADLADSRRIYQEMYARLSSRWVDDGCFDHLISALASDRAGIDGWQWLGFGMIAADAVRDLEPAPDPSAGVDVRRGRLEDIEQAMALDDALQRHMAAAPTFLAHGETHDRGHYQEWLGDPANALWLAYRGTEAVAYMRQGPASTDACTIIRDETTTSIVGAFTQEHARGRGIATALLNRSLDWARSEGYERCAVDFEPMNILAARFWLRHFSPVCYSLVRHVDERIAWAHERREKREELND